MRQNVSRQQELDVIQTKRGEVTKDRKQEAPAADTFPVKKKKKGSGKGKRQEEDPAE